MKESILKQAGFFCCVIVLSIGVLGVVDWLSDLTLFTALGLGYKPMGASTALGFVLCGACLCLILSSPKFKVSRVYIISACVPVMIFSALRMIELFMRLDLRLDKIFTYGHLYWEEFNLYRRMSPVTTVAFFLTGCAVLMFLFLRKKSVFKDVPGWLVILVMFIALTMLLGYSYDVPMFQGGRIIPMAFSSSLAFLFLSVGLICAFGREHFPLRPLSGTSAYAILLRAFFPIIFIAALTHSLIYRIMPAWFTMNYAFFSMFTTAGFMAIACIIVFQVSRGIAATLDRAEGERLKARGLAEWLQYQNKLILDSVADGIIGLDLNGRHTFVNPAAARMLGYKAEELIGKKSHEIWHHSKAGGEPYLESTCPIHQTHKGDLVTFVNDEVFWKKDATCFPVEYSRTPIMEAGMFVGKVVVFQDITERKHAQAKLITAHTELSLRQQELDRAKRLADIGTLAATVAHELRNPLSTIALATSNIKRKTRDESLLKNLQNIEKKIAESDSIINNLLFYSKLRPPVYEKIDICALLNECIDQTLNQVKKEIIVKRSFGALNPVTAEVDPLQMKEVFYNILNNAADALPARGGRIEVGICNDQTLIKISFKDNGVGIDEDALGKVFEPFFSTKPKGTGLGLPVCLQVVTLHAGSMRVESKTGKGTEIQVDLPVSAIKQAIPLNANAVSKSLRDKQAGE
ncbi:MAG: ATP-binding protein [Candidatus Omnitrophota bacterium]